MTDKRKEMFVINGTVSVIPYSVVVERERFLQADELQAVWNSGSG